ncbi:hypothetical protein V6255_04525 [Psychromonas arctica]|uniref:Uncharacterized protein n=1 Tax=Psychromonas arctica TaxID=168275 RepID=A0ABU9H947_9GAMM
MDIDYNDATVNCIIRPQPSEVGRYFDEWVNINSDLWQKERIVQIRRYQSIECRDGMSMDTSSACWQSIDVFPLTGDLPDKKTGDTRQYLVGGVCFKTYREGKVVLEFCWIHPFWRNRGLLKKNWEIFEDKFGDFFVSNPRTKSMKGFLNSIKYTAPQT